MCKKVCLSTITAIVIGLVVGGCSTFEVRDVYIPTGNESELLAYNSGEVELQAQINPDTRFYSIGVFGLPIIPVYFNVSDPSEITLAIGLTLRQDYDFSLAAQPCLEVVRLGPLCPYILEVSAVGMFQDDGSMYADKQKRWQKISSFYETENRILSLSTTVNDPRVNREHIYQYYGYTGDQKWNYLRVNFTYKYKCDEACPELIKLNAKDLIIVGEFPMPNGNYSFEKIRNKNYQSTTPVQ